MKAIISTALVLGLLASSSAAFAAGMDTQQGHTNMMPMHHSRCHMVPMKTIHHGHVMMMNVRKCRM